jgi:hypothetical protein
MEVIVERQNDFSENELTKKVCALGDIETTQ